MATSVAPSAVAGDKQRASTTWFVCVIGIFVGIIALIALDPWGALKSSRLIRVKLATWALTPENTSYIALCLQACDENPHIREWVLYHHMIGVNKFYVFDDGSSVPMRGVLKDLIEAGLVEYTYYEELNGSSLERPGATVQDSVYNTCLHRYGSRHTWMGFIDADEFIILHDEMWLPGVLEEYTQYGGLVLYWKLFGSSGHVQRPAEGVLRSYTKCSLAPPEIRSNLKTIARTDACKEVVIVHQCKYRKDGSVPPFAVDVHGRRVDRSNAKTLARHDRQRVQLYHYITRSRQDWEVKVNRGPGTKNKRFKLSDFAAEDYSQGICTRGVEMGEVLWERYGRWLPPPT